MKKYLALLLAMLMLLSLVACGGSTTTTPDVLVGDTTDEPETPGDTTEDEVGGVWDGDYETATFADVRKYGIGSTRWDGSLPLSTTGEEITIGMRTNSKVTDYETNPYTVYLEEQTGLNITVVEFVGSSADVSTQLSLMMSGGEQLPDILSTETENTERMSAYMQAGYFYNLSGYLMTDSYYFKKALDAACKDDPKKAFLLYNKMENLATDQVTGYLYGPVDIFDNPTDIVQTETHINIEWMEKLGLKMPTTIDELYDVLVAFRDKDPNGNGKKDEIPLMGLAGNSFGRSVDSYLINAFIQYTATRKAMIEDGKTFSVYDTDEYREALKFINKLVKEGLLSELAFTGTATELRQMINPQPGEDLTVGIVCAWITGDFFEEGGTLHKYQAMPALKDAGYGRGGYSMFGPTLTVTQRWGIPIGTPEEKVQTCWRLMDFMYTPDNYLRQRWGEEGVDWDWIENTEFKDKAEGNGTYGGRAAFVVYQRTRTQSRWFTYNTWCNEVLYQMYVDPENPNYFSQYFKKSVENVKQQQAIGAPEETFDVFPRTPEEEELFQEYNSELGSLINAAKSEFCMGRRDPNSDADWNAYLGELKALKHERWAELTQASYDRQMVEYENFLKLWEVNHNTAG